MNLITKPEEVKLNVSIFEDGIFKEQLFGYAKRDRAFLALSAIVGVFNDNYPNDKSKASKVSSLSGELSDIIDAFMMKAEYCSQSHYYKPDYKVGHLSAIVHVETTTARITKTLVPVMEDDISWVSARVLRGPSDISAKIHAELEELYNA